MCGIFAIVSKSIDAFTLDADRRLPDMCDDLSELKRALATLDFQCTHHTYAEAGAREHWRALLGDLGKGGAAGSEETRRDVAWRVEHDLLDLVGAMSALLEDPEHRERGVPVWLAWQVELTLRALGRLEVRGRDSAGLAVMLWYDDEAARDLVASGDEAEEQVFRHAVPGTACLVLSYKVAEEVGALGYNESTLRGLIRGDACFRRAIRAAPRQAIVMAHTRWASNGIISIANAHPVDGALEAGGGYAYPPGRTLAVLNGDVDNFLELLPSLAEYGTVPAGVTTDAKVIPALVETGLNGSRRTGDAVDHAVLATFERIEGSVATVLTRADRPGKLWCALKGTGQSLYLADAGDALVVASEVYGSAELTDRFWPLEKAQERQADGHDAVVVSLEVAGDGRPCIHRLSGQAPACLEPASRTAEITTRDVDRRGFTHFFRKELEEAVRSVRQTIANRYRRAGTDAGRHEEAAVDFSGLYGVAREDGAVRDDLFAAVGARELRRFVFVGQGSAHVAGQVGSRLLAAIVGDVGLASQAMTAGDFSAHELRSDLSHTCLVAISQSGTTTDTNRCLALARQRGARVIGIVNRRNSAMVELCDAVIYTSDGRDVEMAVASTKAFYSQVAAAFMLAQHLGLAAGAVVPTQVAAALAELERLPAVMAAAFALEEQVERHARAVGLARRHWSVLGSGASLATGEEIRIKLSELCYKSVSVDLLENKKHIDLSAEPLILAVLHDLRADLMSDAVKEVSIFAAHRAVTVVICDRDGDRYRGHTPYVVEVPPIGYGLGAVTTAIVGHLFAYHTAVAMDEVAQRLRRLRKALIRSQTAGTARRAAGFALADEARALLADLMRGKLDALLPAGSAGRLAVTFQILASEPGTMAGLGALIPEAGDAAVDVDAWCRDQLSAAIADSMRSIDSIRHQAKTITVGTSRAGYSRTSVMGRALAELGVGVEDLPPSLHSALAAVDDLAAAIPSGIRYEIAGGTLRVARKIGLATGARSRFEDGAPLTGTKLTAVRRRQAMVVEGVRDGARLLVFPVLRRGQPVEVVLLHLELAEGVGEQAKLRFLEAFPQRAEQLTDHFGEILGRPVELRELARLDSESLLFAPPATIEREALAYETA